MKTSFLVALTIATVAVAEPPSDVARSGPPPESNEKPICRAIPQTGTRFSQRVCHSALTWQELDRRTVNGDGFAGLGAGGRQQGNDRVGPAGHP